MSYAPLEWLNSWDLSFFTCLMLVSVAALSGQRITDFGFDRGTTLLSNKKLPREAPMTPEQRKRMQILCEQIAKEQDHHRLVKPVQELNDLLDHKEPPLERRANKPEWRASA
jgi:hypothetical protein